MTRPVARAAFAGLLAVTTWKLVEPRPVPEAVAARLAALADVLPFLLAKATHLGAYAALTALGLLSAGTPAGRAVVVAGLLAHAAATEAVQTVVPNRTGRIADVAIDAVGVAVGAALTGAAVRRGGPAGGGQEGSGDGK